MNTQMPFDKVPFEKFSEKAKKVLTYTQEEANKRQQPKIATEHLLLALLRDPEIGSYTVLHELGVDYEKTVDALSRKTPVALLAAQGTSGVQQVIRLGLKEMESAGHDLLGPGHLLVGMLLYKECMGCQVLESLGVNVDKVRKALSVNDDRQLVSVGVGPSASKPVNGYLSMFTTDLNAKAKAGKLDPVIGRDEELTRICAILGRRTKNNVVLLGDPGVGKTALADGLASRIENGLVPESLKNRRILALDMTALVAGTRYRGEFEERIKQVINEATADRTSPDADHPRGTPNIVLFIDELHVLIGAGSAEGAMDAANILKPALANGDIQVIGATTQKEYRRIEKDAALERRFKPLVVKAPAIAQTEHILNGVKPLYEAHHQVRIGPDAIHAAAVLSDRYITERELPDKAIDLIDEASSTIRQLVDNLDNEIAKAREAKATLVADRDAKAKQLPAPPAKAIKSRNKEIAALDVRLNAYSYRQAAIALDPIPVISADDISDVVAAWTGVPVARMTRDEKARYAQMESMLGGHVLAQTEAVKKTSKAVRAARAGLSDPNRPIASMIFVGPTGVGKTELARALAEFLFDDPEAMTRLDMSEFQEKHMVARLVGSPPGYVGHDEGGQLTEAVRLKPFSVVLFDEIEKAHPDVLSLLLQINSNGKLSDAKGKEVNFANTVIILTSNLGTQVISSADSLGFKTETNLAVLQKRARQERRKRIDKALKGHFRPEFLIRFKDIVVFEELHEAEILQIADIKVSDIVERASEQNILLVVSEAARTELMRECAAGGMEDEEQQVGTMSNPADGFQYGARPMQELVEIRIKDSLAEQIVAGKINSGDTALIDFTPMLGYTVERQQPKVLVPVAVGIPTAR